ncbi:hypothetical protein MBCUT_04510 [Methanobrevibacter cuticularis]|uniref:Radical SAM core domain-containing protein n=1 Tax=Methanobrevibacter cuticularis TaxID=47311 RepID=A0A166EQH2_9EURY|nr:archaeosine biosynthesis radical SAM protein RaSEA [Methanobrevibacter cuticularis]KZX16900.1 hypothetical protein MBCUT_04510 [Methanobrevibacter cuticularis]
MEIQILNKEIRNKSLERMKKRSPEELATSWYQDDLLYSGKGKTIFIILPTPGCSWALGDAGGCTMCSYISDCTLEPIESFQIIELFKREFQKYGVEKETAVKIFASGSFLNPKEVPADARNEILKYLAKNSLITEIIVESRPEYIKEDVLEEIFSIIKNKLFEISIGLESSNDFTREEKINKGFSKEDFESGIAIIKKMKAKHDVKSKAYILIKPILTSEKEAITEAVETARYCENIGVDRVSFCPATIHKGTLIDQMWRLGSYQPPWIWSAIEIINIVRKEIAIPSLMDTSGFGSRRGPYNCKKCNKDLKHEIISSNLDQSLIENYECSCKNLWLADINSSNLNMSKTKTKHLPLI